MLLCKCALQYKTLFILLLYIPPSTSTEDFELFFESLEQLECLQTKNILILGDFNVPDFVNLNNTDTRTFCLSHFMHFVNVNQFNSVLNSTNRILDLVFSNVHCVIVRDVEPLVPEDVYHPALILTLNDIGFKEPALPPNDLAKTYNFRKADFPSLYSAILQTNWDFLNEFDTADLALESFYNQLHEIFDSYVIYIENLKGSFHHGIPQIL